MRRSKAARVRARRSSDTWPLWSGCRQGCRRGGGAEGPGWWAAAVPAALPAPAAQQLQASLAKSPTQQQQQPKSLKPATTSAAPGRPAPQRRPRCPPRRRAQPAAPSGPQSPAVQLMGESRQAGQRGEFLDAALFAPAMMHWWQCGMQPALGRRAAAPRVRRRSSLQVQHLLAAAAAARVAAALPAVSAKQVIHSSPPTCRNSSNSTVPLWSLSIVSSMRCMRPCGWAVAARLTAGGFQRLAGWGSGAGLGSDTTPFHAAPAPCRRCRTHLQRGVVGGGVPQRGQRGAQLGCIDHAIACRRVHTGGRTIGRPRLNNQAKAAVAAAAAVAEQTLCWNFGIITRSLQGTYYSCRRRGTRGGSAPAPWR